MRKKKDMEKQTRAAIYAIDLEAGYHAYAFVEGVGECRQNFMKLVENMESGTFDVVVVAKAKFLFIDTSPMWMEKFIATAKRCRIVLRWLMLQRTKSMI